MGRYARHRNTLVGYQKPVRIDEIAVAELINVVESIAVSSDPMVMVIVPSLEAAIFRLVASS